MTGVQTCALPILLLQNLQAGSFEADVVAPAAAPLMRYTLRFRSGVDVTAGGGYAGGFDKAGNDLFQTTLAQAGRIIWDADGPGRKLAQDRGNQFHMLGAAELDQWRKLSQSVQDEWVKEMAGKGRDGAALLKAAQGLIAQHSK